MVVPNPLGNGHRVGSYFSGQQGEGCPTTFQASKGGKTHRGPVPRLTTWHVQWPGAKHCHHQDGPDCASSAFCSSSSAIVSAQLMGGSDQWGSGAAGWSGCSFSGNALIHEHPFYIDNVIECTINLRD